ncbi:MAG: hypothetical protein ACYCSO_09695 [Cuniculiplasma sp.]
MKGELLNLLGKNFPENQYGWDFGSGNNSVTWTPMKRPMAKMQILPTIGKETGENGLSIALTC